MAGLGLYVVGMVGMVLCVLVMGWLIYKEIWGSNPTPEDEQAMI